MNQSDLPLSFPFPVIFSLITAFIGALIIYAAELIIEEEQHEFEAVILAHVQDLVAE
jgi:hypothetical protein